MALSRRTRIWTLAVTGLVVLLLLVAAAFPLSWLKGAAERQLSHKFGESVQIGALDREDAFSFHPVIRLSDVHVAQADWAGKGEMASIRLLRLRLSILPLLVGRFDADLLTAQGVRLNLVRAADGRENWRKDKGRESGGGGTGMETVSVDDALLDYRDTRQKRSATLHIRIDPKTGLFADGTGLVDGAPVRLSARGGPMVAALPWAFDGRIEGQALAIHAKGNMAGPLRTDDMTLHVTARGDNLKRIDRVIEVGLFGTQPVQLSADVRRADETWTISSLNGTIGESRVNGRLTAHKVDGRMKLDADIRFPRLNFEDLASDAGNAKAVALEKEVGLKIVPNTRVNIHKIDKTDGRIAIRVDQVMSGRRPTSIKDVRAVLNLDNRILTVDPLSIGLSRGAITGRAVVDQRDGQPKPKVTLALDMTDSRISALAGSGGKVDARVDARVRLTGTGDTIREAVGNSDGTVGVVARSGSLPTKIAAFLGFDIGKALIGGDDEEQVALRCAVVNLRVSHGRGTVDPLLVDTSISQTRGRGTISFPSETLALALTGSPKGGAALRLPGSVSLDGTIREPRIVLPKDTKSVGTLLKAIGRALSGDSGPVAVDADCGALTHAAIGG